MMDDEINIEEDALDDYTFPLQAMGDPLPAENSYRRPTISPDEMVIRQRGRKYFPISWSPDVELPCNPSRSANQTPPKNTSNYSSIRIDDVTSRTTPLKRLLLDNPKRIPLTPDKIDFSDISTPPKFKLTATAQDSPPIKRMKVDNTIPNEPFKGPIETGLKGLSQMQLVSLIKTVVIKHPDIEQEIRSNMPLPDMAPLEERLIYLKSNIFKRAPTSRLTLKTDQPEYSRASTHLAAFSKCLVEQGKTLVESQHWQSVIEYVLLAWRYVRATPIWDNDSQNAHRSHCFKALTTFCMTALKEGSFGKNSLIDIQDSLQGMIADSEHMQSCLMYIEAQLHV